MMRVVLPECSARDGSKTTSLHDDETHPWLCLPHSDAEMRRGDSSVHEYVYFFARDNQWMDRMSHVPFTRGTTINSAFDESSARSVYVPCMCLVRRPSSTPTQRRLTRRPD